LLISGSPEIVIAFCDQIRAGKKKSRVQRKQKAMGRREGVLLRTSFVFFVSSEGDREKDRQAGGHAGRLTRLAGKANKLGKRR